MILTGNFVFISGEKVERGEGANKKVYCNVNMECIADGDIVNFNTSEDVINKMQKYQSYLCYVQERKYTYEGQQRVSKVLQDVEPLKPVK